MNYIGNYWGLYLVFSLITVIGILIAHLLFRMLYIGREYPGVSISEDLFILFFTIPYLSAGGYVIFILPIGLSFLLSIVFYVFNGVWPAVFTVDIDITSFEWPNSAKNWVMLLAWLSPWYLTVLAASAIRRKIRRNFYLNKKC